MSISEGIDLLGQKPWLQSVGIDPPEVIYCLSSTNAADTKGGVVFTRRNEKNLRQQSFLYASLRQAASDSSIEVSFPDQKKGVKKNRALASSLRCPLMYRVEFHQICYGSGSGDNRNLLLLPGRAK